MKPILFNTDMVRAILEDRKTATRRVVKPQPTNVMTEEERRDRALSGADPYGFCVGTLDTELLKNAPYRPGDTLYVREAWRVWRARRYEADVHIEFKAGGDGTVLRFPYGGTDSVNRKDYDKFFERWGIGTRWHPSIHMPREAARIFLRVKNISVNRAQDTTDEGARKEGCENREDFRRVWNDCYAKPRPVKGENGIITHYESYPWENINETRTYRGKLWYVIGNPWVWVIEFERISREEVMPHKRGLRA